MSDPRPNILFITTDMQRYDALGINGNAWVKTANLDALAKRGVVFDRAFVQNTVCIPSRACMQTGRYTHQHGVQYMESVIDDTPGLPAYETTFMERLQCAGYRTGGYGKIHMMPEKGFHEMQVTGGKGARWTKSAGLRLGLGPLGRDYAAWLEERHPGAYESIYAARRRPEYEEYLTAIEQVLPLEEYVDYWTAQNTIDFILRNSGRPFFVQCGLHGPHGPLDPPAPYDSLYPVLEEIPLPANYGVDMEGAPRATTPRDDELARRYISRYWGLVALIDDQVGRIVSALKEAEVLDNTLIIFTADHGQMLFERGERGIGFFFEQVLHVPLVVVPPGSDKGVDRASGLVETYDVAPTVLDYAQAEIPANMSASSLRPLVEGRGSGKQLVLSEYRTNDRSARGICVRTERGKYIFYDAKRKERFYDLEQDPLERNNLVGNSRYADEIARHRALMIERLLQTPH